MKKILLATDFTYTAVRASEIAIDLARRAGDSLVLLHVSEPPTQLVVELTADARAFEQAMRERALSELRSGAEQLRAQGITVEERLESGDPPAVISAVAKEIGARLIVLGSHGRRAVARLLLGSVAQGTVLHADRPVLVARSGADARGIDEWAAGTRPLRVVFALDRSPGTAAALVWLRWLREIGPVDVRFVHAYEPMLEFLRRGVRANEERKDDIEPELERELRTYVGELPGRGGVTYSVQPSSAQPGEIVAAAAEPGRADLLVVGTHQRTRLQRIWLGSTAELALRAARVPVVCVPAVSQAVLEDAGKADAIC